MWGVSSTNGERIARVRTGLKAATRRLAGVYVALLALAWFGAALATTLWVWGIDPQAFQGDEAVNRMAAALFATSTAHRAVPWPTPKISCTCTNGRPRQPRRADLPASHVLPVWAAKQARCGRPVRDHGAAGDRRGRLLLRHRSLAAVVAALARAAAPLLGMPATYWLLRPWSNVSLMLTCSAGGSAGGPLARTRTTLTGGALFSVGAAAAVRPDYAAHLLTAAMLFSLAVAPRSYRKILGVCRVGVCAVGVNCFEPRGVGTLPAVYEAVLDRDHGVESAGSFGLLHACGFRSACPRRTHAGVHSQTG